MYRIPCKDCDKSYYGQTGSSLSQRLTVHKRSVRYGQETSAIFQHIMNEDHRIEWEQSELIYKSSCVYKRKIIEAATIKQMNNFNISEGQWRADYVDSILIKTDMNKVATSMRGRPPEIGNNRG